MHAAPAYPYDAVGGGCFITGRYQFDEGERCLDLDVDLDALPPYGRLVLSERAIKGMVVELGWTLLTPELTEHIDTLEAELSELRSQLDELSDAMAGMVDVPAVRKALDVVARRVGGKDSLDEWLETLPKVNRR